MDGGSSVAKFNEEDWQSHNEYDWDETPARLWDNLTHGQGWDDNYGKMLFEMSFADPETADVRRQAYDFLREWMTDEYGLDFDDAFNWELWREWYG